MDLKIFTKNLYASSQEDYTFKFEPAFLMQQRQDTDYETLYSIGSYCSNWISAGFVCVNPICYRKL